MVPICLDRSARQPVVRWRDFLRRMGTIRLSRTPIAWCGAGAGAAAGSGGRVRRGASGAPSPTCSPLRGWEEGRDAASDREPLPPAGGSPGRVLGLRGRARADDRAAAGGGARRLLRARARRRDPTGGRGLRRLSGATGPPRAPFWLLPYRRHARGAGPPRDRRTSPLPAATPPHVPRGGPHPPFGHLLPPAGGRRGSSRHVRGIAASVQPGRPSGGLLSFPEHAW
jgi:hypothetical protein